MSESTLKTLLKEYEQKKLKAEIELDKRVENLYKENPRLEQIDKEINNFAINTAKLIISSPNSTEYINDLKKKTEELKLEKSKILKKINITEDFFVPKYECEICKDTGYVHSNFNSSLCNCIKQKLFNLEYNKSNISNIQDYDFKNFSLDVYSDSVDEKLYKSNISPKQNIINIKEICENFIDNFDDSTEKNLLFIGNTGLGKTYLSSCIANEILKKGKTVLYQTASVMLDTILDYRFGKANISKEVYDNILEVDLLIIDDLGTECMNSMKYTELFDIINTRILNQNNHITKTIISTNLNLQNIKDTYDERIFSRFVGNYNICRFFGEDIRFKKLNN